MDLMQKKVIETIIAQTSCHERWFPEYNHKTFGTPYDQRGSGIAPLLIFQPNPEYRVYENVFGVIKTK